MVAVIPSIVNIFMTGVAVSLAVSVFVLSVPEQWPSAVVRILNFRMLSVFR